MKHLLFTLCILFLVSCSVQKRRYQPGFYVSNRPTQHHLKPIKKEVHSIVQENERSAPQPEQLMALGSMSNDLALALTTSFNKKNESVDSCDVLMFRDGTEISGKISEVSATEVRYKRCDNLEGPTFVTLKSDLFMIKYSNGTREVMKEEVSKVQKSGPSNNNGSGNTNYHQNSLGQPTHPAAIAAFFLGIGPFVLSFFLRLITTVAPLFPLLYILIAVIAPILALIAAKRFRKADRENPEAYKGKGLATTGVIFATILLSTIALVAFFAILIALLFI